MPHIYTKTGDKGQTSLFNGKRVPKNDLRVSTYGKIDQVVSHIGYSTSLLTQKIDTFSHEVEFLTEITKKLFFLGFEIADQNFDIQVVKYDYINNKDVKKLETYINKLEKSLPSLTKFILINKSEHASYLQVCRTEIRALERHLVEVSCELNIRSEVLRYINRLSDYIFMLSRDVNYKCGNNIVEI